MNNSLIDYLLAILFGVIIVIMSMGIFYRYVLNGSLYWSDEVVRYLFVWLTFLGTAASVKSKKHLRVTFFFEKMPASIQQAITQFNELAFIIFLIFLTAGGFVWVFMLSGTYSPALKLPLNWFFYGALPISSLITLYYLVTQYWKAKRKSNDRVEEYTDVVQTELIDKN